MSAEIRIYNPEGLAAPLGKYHHVAVADGGRIVHIAGQVGVDEAGVLAGDLENQVRRVFANLGVALRSAGGDFAHVVKFTTFLVQREDVAAYMRIREAVFAECFPSGRYPPNTLVIVGGLVHEDMRIEVEAVAAI